MTTTPAPALLTASQVAELFEVNAETVRSWARKGKVAHITLPSGAFRFREQDIADLLKPKAVRPVAS